MGRRVKHLLADVPLRALWRGADVVWPLGPLAFCGGMVIWQWVKLGAINALTLLGTIICLLGALSWYGWRVLALMKVTFVSRYGIFVENKTLCAPDRCRFDEWISTLLYYWSSSKPKENWSRGQLRDALRGLWVQFVDEPATIEESPSYVEEPLIVRWAAGRRARSLIKVGSCPMWSDKKTAWAHVRHLCYHQLSHALLFRLDPRRYYRAQTAHIRMDRACILTRSKPPLSP